MFAPPENEEVRLNKDRWSDDNVDTLKSKFWLNHANETALYTLQKQRFANLSKFKASVYKILIATDVAAR